MAYPILKLRLVCGDITTFDGDVIVNAANPVMLGGGGVDGAIHRAGGPGLRWACEAVRANESGVRCPVGQVRPTPAFDLPAAWVFHTVAPILKLQRAGELRPGEVVPTESYVVLAQQMRDAYKRCLLVAVGMGLRTIAFPALGCGIYGWSHEQVANIAMMLFRDYAKWPVEVSVYLYPADSYPVWKRAADEHGVFLVQD